VLSRTESYLGVMVDDLVSRGVTEPYRMFTSRAEFRLHLRSDNADQRLTDMGIARSLVGAARAEHHRAKMAKLKAGKDKLRSLTATPTEARAVGLSINADGVRRSAYEVLSYPSISVDALVRLWPEVASIDAKTLQQLEIDAQYAVYLERQREDVEAVRRDEGRAIPDWVDYDALPGLSSEMRQKLKAIQPLTIAQAQRIEGMTPAAVTLLLAVIKRGSLLRRAV